MARREIRFEKFEGLLSSWTTVFEKAAKFASDIGPDRVINISHSQQGVVAVWYWSELGGEAGSGKLKGATPVFLVGDIAKTMEWYKSKLGFEGEAIPPRPPHNFAILRKDDVEIFLQQLDGYRHRDHYDEREGGVWAAYLRTQDVEAWYKKLKDVPGVKIVQPLRRQEYGQWEFEVRDPDGHVLVFAEPG